MNTPTAMTPGCDLVFGLFAFCSTVAGLGNHQSRVAQSASQRDHISVAERSGLL